MTIVLLALWSSTLRAQEPTDPSPPPAAAAQMAADEGADVLGEGASEWMIGAGPAFGVVVFHSAGGHRYTLQTVSWGRVLTRPRGPGLLRGRFELAFEVAPVYAQWAPTRTYGFGVTPLLWRWNFSPHGRLAPFAELAGGGLWTRAPVPAQTTTANFTAHAGYGLRYFLAPQRSLNVSYRFHHISNGNRLDRNPGVNAHVFMVGLSIVRPRH